MRQLINLQDRVNYVLTKYPETRNNDMLLYLKYAELIDSEYQQNVVKKPFGQVIVNLKDYNLPSFESVGRVRRKLQELYPKLRAVENVQELRTEKEYVYKDYSRAVK